LDVEIVKVNALKKAWEKAKLPSEKEHVTYYITQRGSEFRMGNLSNNLDLSHFRWTVDEPEDFTLVDKIYQKLYKESSLFTMQDVLNLLRRQPEFVKINDKLTRNKGLIKSLKEDEEFLNNEL
jgi:spore coat polysaccharide biosynthesis protein SpsF